MNNHTDLLKSIKYQTGAAAIEFALLFVIFFTFFYATVTYSLVFLLQTSFYYAASEGARSAISVDHQSFANDATYLDQGLAPVVRLTVGNALSWLPAKARDQVLGQNNAKVSVTYSSDVLTVSVVYPNYVINPLIPNLVIPGIGSILKVPNDIKGTAVLKLS